MDQGREQSRVRAGTCVDEEPKIADEVRIGKLIETGKEELHTNRCLNQSRCGQRGLPLAGIGRVRDLLLVTGVCEPASIMLAALICTPQCQESPATSRSE